MGPADVFCLACTVLYIWIDCQQLKTGRFHLKVRISSFPEKSGNTRSPLFPLQKLAGAEWNSCPFRGLEGPKASGLLGVAPPFPRSQRLRAAMCCLIPSLLDSLTLPAQLLFEFSSLRFIISFNSPNLPYEVNIIVLLLLFYRKLETR